MTWQQLIPIAGVAFLVLLAWLLGTFKTARLDNEGDVRARFAQDFPDIQPNQVLLGTDGRAALLVLDNDLLGAVFSVGDRLATRLFQRGDIERSPQGGHEISIKTRDITIPYLNIKGVAEADMAALSHSSETNGGAS